jgi:hypothetical protein
MPQTINFVYKYDLCFKVFEDRGAHCCPLALLSDRHFRQAPNDDVQWTVEWIPVFHLQNNLSVCLFALLKLPNAQWETDIGLVPTPSVKAIQFRLGSSTPLWENLGPACEATFPGVLTQGDRHMKTSENFSSFW